MQAQLFKHLTQKVSRLLASQDKRLKNEKDIRHIRQCSKYG